MKKVFLMAMVFVSIHFAYAQNEIDRMFYDTLRNTGYRKTIVTSDNGFLISGSRIGLFGTSDPDDGELVKLDSLLNFEWAKAYTRGVIGSNLTISDVVQLADGGFLAICHREDSISPATYATSKHLLRTDVSGNLIFVKTITDSAGMMALDDPKIVSITDTTFYVGFKADGTNGNAGICKIDINGNVLNAVAFRNYSGSYTATLSNIQRLNSGEFLIVYRDQVTGPAAAQSMNFVFMDDDLNILHYITHYANRHVIILNKVVQGNDNSLYVSGQIQFWNNSPTPFVAKFNPYGSCLWAKHYTPSMNYPMDFRTSVYWNNSLFVAGTNGYLLDYIPYVLEIGQSGNILNSQTYTHTGQWFYTLDMLRQRDSLFVFVNGKATPPSVSGSGVFSCDSTLLRSCSGDEITFTAVDDTLISDSSIYITNISFTTTDVTADFNTYPVVLSSLEMCATTTVDQVNDEFTVSIYPNPSENGFTISSSKFLSSASVCIFDLAASVIGSVQIVNSNSIHISTADFSPGIYFVRISSNSSSVVKKVVVYK